MNTLAAIVVARRQLHYSDGADAATDRPAHVRAGSSLARTRAGIALMQDDANFVALIAPDLSRVRAIALPVGDKGKRLFDDERGTKKHKLDHEACVTVEDEDGEMLLAFGSGSKRRRERVAMIRRLESPHPDVTLVHAPFLYERLRGEPAFAGSRLNIEGAIQVGDVGDAIRFFSRGNKEERDGVGPVNATCDMSLAGLLAHLRDPQSPPPTPMNIVNYDLGAIDGIRLSFTDAAVWGETILYSATAEASKDAVDDGRVAGSAVGVFAQDGSVRWAPVSEPSGRVFAGKVEGLLPLDGDRLLVVVDSDDHAVPSELCTVELRGAWR